MKRGYNAYIWQRKGWPNWRYQLAELAAPLAAVSHVQGVLHGRLADVGVTTRRHASLAALTNDVIRTCEIEGEHLDASSVRSSIARRLGVDIGALSPADRHVDGVVEMVPDATANCSAPLTQSRLFGWHAALFPTGFSGTTLINVGALRDDARGPMQVLSGAYGRERIHFEAPPASALVDELSQFLEWVNNPKAGEPALIRAGIGHLWLVTLHPFDDGNGRVARAVGDLLLARADASPERFYSLSAQIQRERRAYYDILERTQKGDLDVTAWLLWFLQMLQAALQHANVSLNTVLAKSQFWHRWAAAGLNPRQVRMLNRLFDGFEGKLTSSKWAVLTQCSADTALRDINELVVLGVLKRSPAGGRSTGYELVSAPNG
jgi:Fic family protein